jgi:hypothetical protein
MESIVFCKVCHRKLKNPVSVELGVGPMCLSRIRFGSEGIQMKAFEDIDISNLRRLVSGDDTDRED